MSSVRRLESSHFRLALETISLMLMLAVVRVRGLTQCPTAFFNFGDSVTDTGALDNAVPEVADITFPPYGQSFFGSPAKRFSNGRLIPDFISLAFNQPLLQPYIQAGAFNYGHGVNFAVAGATASNDTTINPFFLPIQVSQFTIFKSTTESVRQQKFSCFPFETFLPSMSAFKNGLYTMRFGGNDIQFALQFPNPLSRILNTVIPAAMFNYENAIKTLYRQGARRFLISSLTRTIGCSPRLISAFVGPLDNRGCLFFLNGVVDSWNAGLIQVVEKMRTDLPGVNIAVFNTTAAAEEIESNLVGYGFDPCVARRVCCGSSGGPVDNNYNINITCGRPGSNVCSNVDEYMSWDGVHNTEAYYRIFAKFILEGRFTAPALNYTSLCNLDYSKFGRSVTFDEVSGDTCKVTTAN
ncbi:hypothetical protein Mapa_008064 [Marchantia paleacea]|nr:hypothetical protein Mapa_008064 [Marchantia paleacea]